MQLKAKKGLDIPISGKPKGAPQNLACPSKIALNLEPFGDVRFKLLVAEGDVVKLGEALVESKHVPGQMFVSPAGGVVSEIRRGLKRKLLYIVIAVDEQELHEEHGTIDYATAPQAEIIQFFLKSGLFPHIRLRPFNLVPDPKFLPRDIFVNGYESLPFSPPFEMQLHGEKKAFQIGLDTLSRLTTGRVHLVYGVQSKEPIFTEAENIEKHTVSGVHPSGSSSFHIHCIAPIRNPHDYVWTLNALDVLIIGKMVEEGHYYTRRILSLAGDGVQSEHQTFFDLRMGYPVSDLVYQKLQAMPLRLISGDPLTGKEVTINDFIGFSDRALSVIPEQQGREPFHFFRLGAHKYSATRAYWSGHISPPLNGYHFTTNQHGEERAFVESRIYDKVMPMRIPTMQLIKAILADDFDLAEQLGFLEVVPEDFALSTFICPSKINMIDIVADGLHRYAQEMGL